MNDADMLWGSDLEEYVPRSIRDGTVRPLWSWYNPDGTALVFDCRSQGLRVMLSISRELDNHDWIHLSISRLNRLPTYEDLRDLKALFIGDDKYAYQVFPTKKDYFSSPSQLIDRQVLHLWARVDGKPVLPDFLKHRGGNL